MTETRRPRILTLGSLHELTEAGAETLYTPLASEESLAKLSGADAVALTGGSDIDPKHYGERQRPETYGIDRNRDRVELDVTRRAIDAGIPVFGICRGAQIINVALGGSLFQDIPSLGHTFDHWGREHSITVAGGEVSRKLPAVISGEHYHHQAVNRLGDGLGAVGWADDGTVELIESADSGLPYILGTQFHPEMDSGMNRSSETILRHFVEKVAELDPDQLTPGETRFTSYSTYTSQSFGHGSSAGHYSGAFTLDQHDWEKYDLGVRTPAMVPSTQCLHQLGTICSLCCPVDSPWAREDALDDWDERFGGATVKGYDETDVRGITDRMSGSPVLGGAVYQNGQKWYVCGICPGKGDGYTRRRWSNRDRWEQHLGSKGHRARERNGG